MKKYEWEIHFDDEIVGYFEGPLNENEGWLTFRVIPKNEKVIFDESNWDNCAFKYFNIARNEFAPIAIPGFLAKVDNSIEINMKGMYIFSDDLKRIKLF